MSSIVYFYDVDLPENRLCSIPTSEISYMPRIGEVCELFEKKYIVISVETVLNSSYAYYRVILKNAEESIEPESMYSKLFEIKNVSKPKLSQTS